MKTILSEIPTEDLERELLNRGYQTDNLWQIADVDTKFDEYKEENHTEVVLTDDQKMEILINAMSNDAVYSAIWEAIEQELEETINELED